MVNALIYGVCVHRRVFCQVGLEICAEIFFIAIVSCLNEEYVGYTKNRRGKDRYRDWDTLFIYTLCATWKME